MLLPVNLLKLSNTFFDQNEKHRAEALSEFLTFANSNRSVIEKLIPVATDEELKTVSLFFEALAGDANNWKDYFLLAFEQLLERANGLGKPGLVLSYLNELAYLGKQPFVYKSKIANKLILLLSHPHATFRWHALILLSDFMDENSFEHTKHIYSLLQDSNWQIRYWADLILSDVDVSYKSKLSLSDRLRSKFLDTTKFD